MRQTGIATFRRVTGGLLASQKLASALPENIERSELSKTLKCAAPALGIRGSTYHVLDILLGLIQSRDLKKGRRPIVAISNAKLAGYICRSVRTASRAIKTLVELGVLAYSDSPTGRRGITRDDEGQIDQGYGLDFSPACLKLDEFHGVAEAHKLRLEEEKRARRLVGARRRGIADVVAYLGDCALSYVERLDELLSRDAGVIEMAREVDALYADLLEFSDKMTCEGDKNDAPYTITTTQTHQNSVIDERGAPIGPHSNKGTDSTSGAEFAFEGKHEARIRGEQQANEQKADALDGVSIGLLSSACRQLASELSIAFNSWNQLTNNSEKLRHLVGLSEAAYAQYASRHGRYLVSACLAVVGEKAMRDPDLISSPGGYFRAMLDRADEQKLHLAKSLHGLVCV